MIRRKLLIPHKHNHQKYTNHFTDDGFESIKQSVIQTPAFRIKWKICTSISGPCNICSKMFAITFLQISKYRLDERTPDSKTGYIYLYLFIWMGHSASRYNWVDNFRFQCRYANSIAQCSYDLTSFHPRTRWTWRILCLHLGQHMSFPPAYTSHQPEPICKRNSIRHKKRDRLAYFAKQGSVDKSRHQCGDILWEFTIQISSNLNSCWINRTH